MKSLLGAYLKDWMDAENRQRSQKREALGILVDEDVSVNELTIYRIARDSGVSEMTLKRIIEQPHYKPGDDVLEALAAYLNEDIYKLFDLKRGVTAEARKEALEMAAKTDQLSDPNRNRIDEMLITLTGSDAHDTKGIALILLNLQQAVDQLTKEVALLRRQLKQ